MIGVKYADGSVLYDLRNEKFNVLLFIKDGKIKLLDVSATDARNNIKIKSEKTALYMISKISHEAICEISELLSAEDVYSYVKKLKG